MGKRPSRGLAFLIEDRPVEASSSSTSRSGSCRFTTGFFWRRHS